MHIRGKDELLILINNEDREVSFTAFNIWKLELSTAPTNQFTLPPNSLAVFSR